MHGTVAYIKIMLVGFLSWTASYFQPIQGVAILFLVLFGVDFATGLLASFSKGDKFRSWKARDSFFKLLIYLTCFAFIIAIGREVSRVDGEGTIAGVSTVLKTVIYIAIWFEAKSNAENLCIVFPRNRFVRFMDYCLGVEFVNKLPWLRNFLDRENKDGVERLEKKEVQDDCVD